MTKFLLLLALAFVAYLLLRTRGSAGGKQGDRAKAQPSNEEAIVACSRCGIHVPISESVEANGRRYCSEEHSRLG